VQTTVEKLMTKVNLDLPEEVFSARRLPPDDFVRDMGLAAAIVILVCMQYTLTSLQTSLLQGERL
jgi:hypothetical protein